MRIEGNIPNALVQSLNPKNDVNESSFKDMMRSALSDVNTMQAQSDLAFEQLVNGEIEFHDAMIIAEKASLALQLTMTIRNKLVDAYQEIMRMQV